MDANHGYKRRKINLKNGKTQKNKKVFYVFYEENLP